MPRFVPAFVALALLAVGGACTPAAQVDGYRNLVVMNLAAHPDDEDGATMAYYRGNRDALVYSVIYTRGEGGQNEAGPDLYERLGAIRTAETEAAARVLGTQVFFLNRYDFGFSKHAAEAFAEWSRPRVGFWDDAIEVQDAAAGREYVTADLVRLIRRLKPDVLFTNHDTTTAWPDAQHGHHQAVGITAYEAFALAADPAYRPDQLDEPGVDLWQPARLFVRTGGFSDGAPSAYDVAVPVADVCEPTRYRPAEPCADRAVAGAALHVSQGFDKFAPRFRREATYFRLYRQSAEAAPLPEGATDLAAGLATPETRRAMTWPGLVDAGRVAALDVGPSADVVVRGETLTVQVPTDVTVERVVGPARITDRAPGRLTLAIDAEAAPTLPAFATQYGRWESSPPLTLVGAGPEGPVAAHLPVAIAPPVVVDPDPDPARLVPGVNRIGVSLRTYDPAAGYVGVMLDVADATGAAVAQLSRKVTPADTAATLGFRLPEDLAAGGYRVTVSAEAVPTTAPGWRSVESRPAAVLPDVAVAPGLRVGFVRSYDGTMGDALRVMGADVVDLDSTALAAGDFGGLHTIVVDIRAYLDRRDLRAHNDRLLDWVRAGGHLVVGYQKMFEWNAGRPHPLWPDDSNPAEGFAPYPLQLGRDRVTVEDAPIDVLAPEHPLFTAPHATSAADWEGWVQERGLYFPSDVDDRYRRLVATGDPGEAPLDTALLLADVGAGTYLYSSLVWYRQLDALNPGAWRLFANLVSLPLTDGRVGPDGVGRAGR